MNEGDDHRKALEPPEASTLPRWVANGFYLLLLLFVALIFAVLGILLLRWALT